MKIARKFSKIISLNPFIRFVGLTGALSMQNADKNSDIDFLIITKAQSLWLTRLSVWLTLKLFSVPLRKPGNLDEKDKLCLNIWLDEGELSWPKKQRNIFTAHEILQIKPLFDCGGIFEKFVSENGWVGDFWTKKAPLKADKSGYPKKESIYNQILDYFIVSLNLLAFFLQRSYMSTKVTRETVTLKRALFHPKDISTYVLERLKKYQY